VKSRKKITQLNHEKELFAKSMKARVLAWYESELSEKQTEEGRPDKNFLL